MRWPVGKLIAGAACLWAAAALGVGCQKPLPTPSATSTEQAARTQALSELDPKAAAERITFLPGDTFEIRQTLAGIGAKVADVTGSRNGIKTVTVDRFAPMHTANLSWSMAKERVTDASRAAQTAYEQARAAGQPATPPPIETETAIATGTLRDAGLQSPHTMFLPAYWPEGTAELQAERSGIWLSDDAYQELARTNQTIVNFGVFDAEANRLVKGLKDVKSILDILRQRASVDGENRDLTLLRADAERVVVPLAINGQTINVSAIRAHNWFGEITVLENRQNPLILKLAINPLSAGISQVLGGSLSSLDRVFGYEVAAMTIAAP